MATRFTPLHSGSSDSKRDECTAHNPEKILEVMARVLPKEVAVILEQRTPPISNLKPGRRCGSCLI
jgi:hypothetical protein